MDHVDDLVQYATTRNPALRQQLAIQHLPLVKFVARKMTSSLPRYIELDDLVSWGSLGLLDAIDKFDPHREVRFSTYAVTRIRGAILDGLQQMDWAPKQVTSKVRQMKRVIELLWHELDREPTTAEIAARMECTEFEVRGWQRDNYQQRVKSIDLPAHGEDGTGGGGFLFEPTEEPEQAVAGEIAEIRERVSAALSGLDEKERTIFLLYYREGLTLRQVAEEIGVSVSSATQIHTRVVERIRGCLAAFGGAVA
jgi:RNA polymerase sigma factor for flagellar operon FliA